LSECDKTISQLLIKLSGNVWHITATCLSLYHHILV